LCLIEVVICIMVALKPWQKVREKPDWTFNPRFKSRAVFEEG